jgi:protein phosphatase 4 regulatory subunit 3
MGVAWVFRFFFSHPCLTQTSRDAYFVVKSDEEDADTVLESRISPEDIYQRQQGLFLFCDVVRALTCYSDTLIVWQEPDTARDIALSFQEVGGCVEIW